MLNKYTVKDGKKMRYGYTTGSCAAAAAKAAVFMAVNNRIIQSIEIDTPKGWKLNLKVLKPEIQEENKCAVCYIKKNAGDDPDITDGMLIGARVLITNDSEIVLKGGEGVGHVTKPGLYVPVGQPAINPVPRKMILTEVAKVLPQNKGAVITITAPEGEKITKKTFNPKLGIVGGISILGTSGIVEPMSDEAFKESLAIELKMIIKEGIDKVVLVPGNYGEEKAIRHFGIDKSYVHKTSNFIGFMLNKCIEENIKKVVLIGHIGKLVKLAGGIFNTHSKVADGRMEIIASNLALLGASQEVIKEVFGCITTESALQIIDRHGYDRLYKILCKKAEDKCISYTYGQLDVGVVMFSMNRGILAIGDRANEILEEF
ncbi:MAG: cobalt-precorrin-5B (C1)-methyltransferase [Candidatus Petromonas sp.]|jgi:cobalt-precorrin-5B (C1)-methyltransferase|nr:cobalt-precorrin-5B (C1)-methyltransferase [Candidatus Petromonas sp.]